MNSISIPYFLVPSPNTFRLLGQSKEINSYEYFFRKVPQAIHKFRVCLNRLFLAVTNLTYFTLYNLLLDLIFVLVVMERTNLMLREVAVASISVTAHPIWMCPKCMQMCPATSLLALPGIVDSISWHLGSVLPTWNIMPFSL